MAAIKAVGRLSLALLATGVLLTAPSPAAGQDFFTVWYPEVSHLRLNFGGDFDGTRSLAIGTRVFEVPALSDANGIAFATGYGYPEVGVVFEYVRADPSASLSTGDEVAAYRSYGLRLNIHHAMTDRSVGVSPLFRTGVTYNTLSVPLSVTQGGFLDDARYTGLGYIAGVGGMIRLPVLYLHAAVERRFVSYGGAKARDSFFELDPKLNGTIDVLSIGGVLRLGGSAR